MPALIVPFIGQPEPAAHDATATVKEIMPSAETSNAKATAEASNVKPTATASNDKAGATTAHRDHTATVTKRP